MAGRSLETPGLVVYTCEEENQVVSFRTDLQVFLKFYSCLFKNKFCPYIYVIFGLFDLINHQYLKKKTSYSMVEA